ncbi:jhy protein homolog [Tiliqua scincoides]|uniref:jhy protein homolog n=1 Tax=Tiliqua scincoides TaxID=71010 RepID=UPI003462A386
MSKNSLPHQGLVQPHVHYSFLKTALEGLSLSEEDFHSRIRDSPESDSESLAQELQYQTELQKRVCKREELVKQKDELEYQSFEEDSLEEEGVSEEGDGEEIQIPSGKENCSNKSNKQEVVDQYAELRYNPNWKNSKEGVAFSELKASHQENDQSSPALSLSSTCSSPQFGFADKNQQQQDQTQNIPSIFDRESPDPCDQSTDVSDPSYQLHENRGEGGRILGVACHYNSTSSLCSDWSSAQARTFKEQRLEKDFVEKNKLTLGLPTPPRNTYLHLHGKRQREGPQRQAHSCPGLQMGRTSSSPRTSLKESSLSGRSLQHSLGIQVEPRSQYNRHHNVLEFENTCLSSNSYREAADFEDSRHLVPCGSYPNPAVAPLRTSVINHSTTDRRDTQFHTDSDYIVHQNDNQTSTCLTLARNPLQPSSYENFPEFSNKKGKKYPHGPDDASGHQRYPCRPSQAPACNPIRPPSPYTQLIQAAERHHQELSQLAGDHLARSQFSGLFPPIVQRGESDPQLNMEGDKGIQSILSRWNSEGYLHQREKLKARKEKENSKGPRTKGYVKMDVKLGGLGPDYATIREKSEKIRQQKEYARQVQEHNMANLVNARKPLPTRPENKSSQSRQKALEYAKMIPRPKPAPLRPPEQEPTNEKRLERTSSRENLPPISSLESLQNRHEKEKQVVAAFRTLHIS